MVLTCPRCQRSNPSDAAFCYLDGSALSADVSAPLQMGSRPFPQPFTLPNGESAQTFNQLAILFHNNWEAVKDLLIQNQIGPFFSGLGRMDLAMLASNLVKEPNKDRALDQLLSRFPADCLEPPNLQVEPTEINLGEVRVDQNRSFHLIIRNKGMGLLLGSLVSGCPWLVVGETNHSQRVFQTASEMQLSVKINGKELRAKEDNWVGELNIDSNGGQRRVRVKLTVPVRAFPEGMLKGATSPRKLAEKARTDPKKAAVWFENGSVERWYQNNGWTYPVQGPTGSGMGAVQQFFEALGLAKAPKLSINKQQVRIRAKAGERLQESLTIRTDVAKPVFASAVSDQSWLVVSKPQTKGNSVTFTAIVPSVPNQPKQLLKANVYITGNGNQRFIIPVMVFVEQGSGPPPIPTAAPYPPPNRSPFVQDSNAWGSAPTPVTVEPIPEVLPMQSIPDLPVLAVVPIHPESPPPPPPPPPGYGTTPLPRFAPPPPPTNGTAPIPKPLPKTQANQAKNPPMTWDSFRGVYWCGIFGGWSAFLGWLIAELLFGRWIDSSQSSGMGAAIPVLFMIVFISTVIGGGLSFIVELANRHWKEQVHRMGPGLIGGLLGGVAGGIVAIILFNMLQEVHYILGYVARILGLTVLGICIGTAEGLYEQSWQKIRNGLLGGALGGFLAGLLFTPITTLAGAVPGRALAFVLMGLFIGFFIGFVQFLLKEAWITVTDGFRPGREVMLDDGTVTMGTSEKSTLIFIAFGAKGVEPVHVFIRRTEEGKYKAEDNNTRSGTLLNDVPLKRPTELKDGDELRFGVNRVVFRESYRSNTQQPTNHSTTQPRSAPATVRGNHVRTK